MLSIAGLSLSLFMLMLYDVHDDARACRTQCNIMNVIFFSVRYNFGGLSKKGRSSAMIFINKS